MPTSCAIAFAYRVSCIGEEYADELEGFLDEVCGTGAELQERSPTLALRNWFKNVLDMPKGNRPANYVYAAFVIKGWNAWITGTPVSMLSWKRGGQNPEPYPALVDREGVPVVFEAPDQG